MNRLYKLDEENIKKNVSSRLKGTYRLGEVVENKFQPLYVGRSDKSLRMRLLQHAKFGIYTFFTFRISHGERAPYMRECVDFHTFSGLDNKIHPATGTSFHRCPICSVIVDFEGCIPKKWKDMNGGVC